MFGLEPVEIVEKEMHLFGGWLLKMPLLSYIQSCQQEGSSAMDKEVLEPGREI